MNYTEYSIVSTKTYIDYCNYLLQKYGAVNGDYFSANFVPNIDIKRRDENLFIHHMREDKVANLSNVDIARANDFEYQKAHNLVYANLLEHILLHIMIGEQNYTLGFGGTELMIAQANDYISDAEDYDIVLEALKERFRNDLVSCETLLQHNETVFYELDDTLSKYDRALVVIGTGLGKTTTALAYIRKYGMRGLVLGPSRVITEAWEKNEDIDTYTYQWFMNNYKSIDYSKYGIMICDEAHHCVAARWGEGIRYALDNGLIKVMGLTATPKENKDKKNLETSRQFFQNHVCQGFTVLDGIEREIIHDFSYVGAIYDTTGIKEMCGKCSDTALLGELDLAINNTPTVKEILTCHMPNNKRKGIIFVSNIGAINEAIDIMKDIYPNIEYRAMHSLMPANEIEENREWFQNTDEGYLLAVNMISEGAHYKGVNTIIMFRRTQSSLVFHQQLGRIITLVRDEDPHAIVFDLVNNATNLDAEKSFSASLREAYRQRKERGGKQKSEQIIVEDYSEKISDVLRKIREESAFHGEALYCIDKAFNIVKKYSRVGKTAEDGFKPNDISQVLSGKINSVDGYYWCFVKDYYDGWRPQVKQRKRAIIIIETGEIVESLTAFKQKYGGDISSHLAGRQKTVSGFHCAYVDDYERIASLQDFVGLPRSIYENKKAVINLDTKEVFVSAAEATRHYPQTNRTGIGNVCHGKQFTCGGYHWMYYADYCEQNRATLDIIYEIEAARKGKCTKRQRVICIENGMEFESMADAANWAGLASSSPISSCCNGKQKPPLVIIGNMLMKMEKNK